ncbi:MAG: DNA alkylation repair protein [Candidatus Aegiribacteria sp.]|nr:DNA alkylation repair protein [Candidatus Aegiribacteria sp.]
MSDTINEISRELRVFAEPERARIHQRFFKTGRGEYGEGDKFLGIRVPYIRKLVRKFRDLSLADTEKLLHSRWHEERLFALLILVDSFKRGGGELRENIYNLYMSSTQWINNWDLVDLSAPHIPGAWLYDRDRRSLYGFAESNDLWKKRIAIISTQYFIRRNDFSDALAISEKLINDNHDLIHKAVGWMLREIGKRNLEAEEKFLRKHYKNMPRTMLRYAIERFPEERRQKYLKGVI